MKSTVFFSAFCLALFNLPLSAQVNFGIRAGLNFNNVHVTDALESVTPDFRTITAWNVAAIAELEMDEYFSIQPELAYSVKGFGILEGIDVDIFNIPIPLGVEAVSEFSYLEMPVLLKGKIGNEKIKAFAYAGPAVGYALDGHLTTRAKVFFEFDLYDTDIDLDAIDYERWEFSGIAGGGVEFPVKNGKFVVDARYQHGFTELYDIPFVNEKIKNKGVSVNVGYTLMF